MDETETFLNVCDAPSFYLSKFRFGELTPSAAKLFCQYQSYTDLNIAQDRLGRFFWVAFPPSGVMPLPITPLWKDFYKEHGSWIRRNLPPTVKTIHPDYIVHFWENFAEYMGAIAGEAVFLMLFPIFVSYLREDGFSLIGAVGLASAVPGLFYAWMARNVVAARVFLIYKGFGVLLFGLGVVLDWFLFVVASRH